jgi:hypothetical protein
VGLRPGSAKPKPRNAKAWFLDPVGGRSGSRVQKVTLWRRVLYPVGHAVQKVTAASAARASTRQDVVTERVSATMRTIPTASNTKKPTMTGDGTPSMARPDTRPAMPNAMMVRNRRLRVRWV